MRCKLLLIACLTLSGCEILNTDEEPGEMSCTVECEVCEKLILECSGETRGLMTTRKEVTG
jgi:hypothetical protein